MGDQGPKPGARPRERSSEAPDPTHTGARPRRAEDRAPVADADTKVERRPSVRPSAFGAPRKSDAPPTSATGASEQEVAAALSPHERVLEAARLLDALAPALRDPELYDDGRTPIQRLPHRRAHGADELVAKSASMATANAAAPAAQGAAAPASVRPVAGVPRSLAAVPGRLVRKPWLSLLLFSGMVALSVVPLLKYAGSIGEGAPAATAAAGVRAASLTRPAGRPGVEAARSARVALPLAADGLDREQAIAGALSEGSRALEAGDLHAAERMFGHVLELAEDNARAAYGLARIRLKQNNLSGAEGWIQLALRKRPRRAAYHGLYAEVLTRMGRLGEARQEQALAQAQEAPRAEGDEREQGAETDSEER